MSTIVNGFAKSEQTADTSDTDSDDICSSDGNNDGASEERLLETLELLRESYSETDTNFNGFEDEDNDDDEQSYR